MRRACFQNYFCLIICLSFFALLNAQTIGTFNSVQPTAQTQNFVLPLTHVFQKLIKSGDALTAGGSLGNNLDFTGYVPIAGSSTSGYLSISSETTPAECAILNISFNSISHTWGISSSGKVTLPIGAGPGLGNVSRFCSGTVSPDNTIIVAEETTASGDANSDGYQDLGWFIEIDPANRTVLDHDADAIVDKLWAVGRQNHENLAIKNDESVIYWGADADPTGYMYKFVPNTPGNYTSGSLYVLQTTASLGTGTWQLVANTTQSDRNNTVSLSTTAGAWNFNGIEDVEIGPDGKIYLTAKAIGRIYRFTDNGATVSNLEVFVESTNYDVDGVGPFSPEAWGIGNDNLAFDGEGNLWVLQDGTRNHIWVVEPLHTAASPKIRLFATTPAGSEPTGITFTPDYKFMFISFQHPSTSNSSSQIDAAGNSVIFNTHTTVVVARKEFLGAGAALPVRFTNFNLKSSNTGIEINWSVAEIVNHSYFVVERSTDNVRYEEIYKNNEVLNRNANFTFKYTDRSPLQGKVYYRLKQCDLNGSCHYSETKTIKFSAKKIAMTVYPVPCRKMLTINYISPNEEVINIFIIDNLGRTLKEENKRIFKGKNIITVNTQKLSGGAYMIICDNGKNRVEKKFTKL